MKILLPISCRFELALSALAAVAIHAVALGYGLGSLDRVPVPRIQQVESISIVTDKRVQREPVKKEKRERVEKDPIVREKISRPDRTVKNTRPMVRKDEADPREKKIVSRKEIVPPRKDRVEPVKRERELIPEGRFLKPDQETEKNALSRTAMPAVETGYAFDYPRNAQRQGYEGRVELLVKVSALGKVLGVEIEKSSGYAILDKSAKRQMMSVPFSPALSMNGEPTVSEVVLGVDFFFLNGKTRINTP